MICETCAEYADEEELIDILINKGYYVTRSENLLSDMDTDELIDELRNRNIMVDRHGDVYKLYYDAITDPPARFQQKLSYYFERTINKRL